MKELFRGGFVFLKRRVSVVRISLLVAGFGFPAQANTLYWDGTTNVWNAAVSAWSTSPDEDIPDPASAPAVTDIAAFNVSTYNTAQTVLLSLPPSVLGLNFLSSGATTFRGETNNRSITLGAGGITLQAGSGGAVIGTGQSNRKVSITLSAAQTWSNNSVNLLNIVGTQNGDLSLGSYQLTVAGEGNTAIAAIIKGAGGSLVKDGSGTLTLTATNIYSGNTSINGGMLSIPSTNSLPGATVAGRYTVASNAVLIAGSAVSDDDVSVMLGTGNFAAGAILGYDTSSGNRTNSGIISNSAAGALNLLKLGTNTLTLSGTNSYSGETRVRTGRITLANPLALGTSSATVTNGAQILLPLSSTTFSNGLTLAGSTSDYRYRGALQFEQCSSTVWAGPITLAGNTTISAHSGGGSYALSGGISGTGNLEFWAGGGSSSHTHTFTISAPCTYTGDTLLNTYAASPVLVLSGGDNLLPTNSTLNMLAGIWNSQPLSATLKLNGNSQTLSGLATGSGIFGSGGTNRVVNGSAVPASLRVDCITDKFFDGFFGGPGSNENNFSFIKSGPAKFTVNRSCTSSGSLTVDGGTLNLAGGVSGGQVTVADGAMLLLGGGSNLMTGLTLGSNAVLGVYAGSPGNLSNTVIQVNGDLVLGGSLVVQDLGDASTGSVVSVIHYTGSLTDSGMVTDPRSQWNVDVDTSSPGEVKIQLFDSLPLIRFTTPDMTVSNALQLDMQGVIHGFPVTPVYYEVRTPDNRLWDFGAMPPEAEWTIQLRHLREGTNTVRVSTLGADGSLQEDVRQVVLQLGTNPPVRPRPYPAEIWWGGVATGQAPDYGYDQLVDPARPWDFVKQYQDGLYLHGILPTPGTLTQLAVTVKPMFGRFGREGGYYTKADLNFGFDNAARYSADQSALAGEGIYLSFQSFDFNPGMRVWAQAGIDPGWCQRWPDWTHEQLVASNMQCWADFVGSMHTNWPGLKLGWTWSPVWFNWNGYPALNASGDNLILHPVKDADGNVVTNQYGDPAWFDFDMQEFFTAAGAVAQGGDGYFGFASDCPYDYFAQWANYSERTNNQAKILGYEAWQQTNGYFATTICNYSKAGGTGETFDTNFLQNSSSYIVAKQLLGGRTQKYLFESWYAGPYTWAPGSNTNSFSGMVKDAIKYLKGIADTNGTLEQLKLTLLTSGTTNTIELRNDGDIACLPAVAGFETGAGSGTVTYYDAAGSNITALVLSAEGYVYTNLLAPGQTTTVSVVTSGSLDRTITLEAFWNPQDPTGVVRDRLTLLPPPNQPPVLAAISNYTIIAGQTLTVTNAATDPDVPPQTLTFSLVDSPIGAMINTSSGVFSWRPAIAQSPSTNTVSVLVTDDGTPNLSATQSFWIAVSRPVQPVIDSVGFSNGQIRLTITGDSGPDYSIFASTNLADWTSILITNPLTPPFIFSDPDATNFSRRFYRILLGP